MVAFSCRAAVTLRGDERNAGPCLQGEAAPWRPVDGDIVVPHCCPVARNPSGKLEATEAIQVFLRAFHQLPQPQEAVN